MRFISGTESSFTKATAARLASYRYRVFVERLGWELDTAKGEERDQFDRPDTVYVLALDDDDAPIGCARLLPTTAPYLLSEVFPQLLNGLAMPRSPAIWELSRFAAVDFKHADNAPLAHMSSPAAVRLLQESIACAARLGAERLVTVSPIGIERLLRRAGFSARRAGPPTLAEGHPLFACWIDVGPAPFAAESTASFELAYALPAQDGLGLPARGLIDHRNRRDS